MSNFNLDNHKYIDLGYHHKELLDLLNKIENGNVLSKTQYEMLIKDIGLENISTFDGDYNKLNNLPDLNNEIEQVIKRLNLASNVTVGDALEALKMEIDKNIEALGKQKADLKHQHDDFYYKKNEIDEMFNGVLVGDDIDLSEFVTFDELSKELLAYATIEYLTLQLENYSDKDHTHTLKDIESIQEEFDKKVNLNDVYNKEQINELLENIGNDIGGNHTHNEYITKENADKLYSKIEDVESILDIIDSLENSIANDKTELNSSIVTINSNLENKINTEKQDLESRINNLSSEINLKLNNKSDSNHTHDIYYSKSEVDNKLAQLSTGGSIDLEGFVKQEDLLEVQQEINELQITVSDKADANHEHKYSISDIEGLQEALDSKNDSIEIPDNIMETINNKADKDHSHNNYADINHTHEFEISNINGLQFALENKANKVDILSEEDILALIKENAGDSVVIDPDHTHEEYALKDHLHEEYALKDHEHDYANIKHSHDEYAKVNHEHDINDIAGLQNTLNNKVESSMVYTKEQIDKKLVDISSGGAIDLEGFIKQSDLMEGLATKSDLGHGHSITEIEGLQEILDDKSYLANLATKEEVTQGLATKADVSHHHDDKYSSSEHTHDEHYTKEQTAGVVNDLLEVKAAEIIAEVTAYADEAVIRLTEGAPEDLNNFAEVSTAIQEQDSKLTNNINFLNSSLASKADISHTHSEYATVEDEAAREIFTTTELTVSTLGGIQAGSNLNGLTIKEILNKLLYPYVAPTISIQGTPNGGIFEKGNVQAITNARVIVTKKSEKITKIEVLQGSTVLGVKEDATIADGGTFNFPVNVKVNSTNVQLTGKVTDASGTVKTSTTAAFNFVYPYYVGVCGENDTVNETLIKGLTKRIEAKGTKAIPYTTNNQKMIIAYPKSYGSIKKILDPNSFDVTDTFTRTELKITGLDGSSQSYYVYVNNASTVSGFTMTFSY